MAQRKSPGKRSLLTVLFTDIVGSTQLASEVGDERWRQLLDAHDALVRAELKEHGGREVKTVGDGFLAAFPSPGDAIASALAIVEGAHPLGLRIRAGLHCGEVERRGRDVGGIGVHIAARISALAGPDEILVSGTVRDLVAGSQIPFVSRGLHALRGVPDKRELFAVGTADDPALGKATARKKTAAQRRTRQTRAPKAKPRGITVLLVDDHPLWRRTLRDVLEQGGAASVIAEAGDGEEAVRVAGSTPADVIVMDIDLPRLDGIAATGAITAANPAAKVLVLSGVKEREQVLAAVRAGASGYLVKTAEPEEVAEALRTVHGGGLAFPPELASVVLQELRSPTAPASPPLRVAVGAARALDRDGLANVLASAGLQVTGVVSSAERLAKALEADDADVAVLDRDSGRTSQDFGDLLSRAGLANKGVIILSGDLDASDAASVVSGETQAAVGYLLKERIHDAGQLVEAARRVANGETVLDPDVVRELLDRKPTSPESDLDRLTDRETATLDLMAQGLSNQAIAETLHVGTKTVEGYIAGVFTKLGLEQSPSEHRRVVAVLTYLQQRR